MDFPGIIDNTTENRRLDVLLNHFVFQSSDLISIAVGYFYFSGFQRITADLLARFWLCADSQGKIEEKHPDSFFTYGKFSKESVNLKNRDITKTEELLEKEFRQRLDNRKEINSTRNISRRLKSFGGKQVELIVLLESVLKSEQTLTGKCLAALLI